MTVDDDHDWGSDEETLKVSVMTGTERAPEPEVYVLVGLSKPIAGRVFSLKAGSNVIGRSDAADVVIRDESISRRHVTIRVEGGEVRMHDLDSTNGTFVNGTRESDAALELGDEIQVGEDVRLRLELRQHAEVAKLTPDAALRDELTGVQSQPFLVDSLRTQLAGTCAAGQPLSLLIADVDRLHQVNSRHGYAAGDAVLKELARCMEVEVGRGMLVARLDDDELVAVLPNVDAEAIVATAERLRSRVAEEPIDCHGLPVPVTVSIAALTVTARRPPDVDHVLERARATLGSAQRQGGNAVSSALIS